MAPYESYIYVFDASNIVNIKEFMLCVLVALTCRGQTATIVLGLVYRSIRPSITHFVVQAIQQKLLDRFTLDFFPMRDPFE